MENPSANRAFTPRTYYLLTKPGIIMGNVITTAGGFALASKGNFSFWLFFATLVGLSFVIGSGCVWNNYIDRHSDQKMKRTKNRALASGAIATQNAIFFALALGVIGSAVLFFFTNGIATAVALFGFFVYVILYSHSKYRTIHGTLIGSIAGAVPPVVGYCAVSGEFDLGGALLFTILAMWQMPHFYSISIYRIEDYAAASIPILPIKRGIRSTKIHMFLYILAFMAISSLLTVFGYTGYAYLMVTSILGLIWLGLSISGFRCKNDRIWARKMFFFSLIVVMGFSIVIPFSIR
jgi:protoheme IX farnesyltransferase